MTTRFAYAALALALAVGACDRDAPTGANTAPETQQPAPDFKNDRATLLTDMPFTNAPLFTKDPVPVPAGVVSGKVTITSFSRTVDATTKTLKVNGTITYVHPATGQEVTQAFENVDARLAGAPTAPVCPILDLDIGAIHLDLLGLVVDLAPIHLDITAVSGPGRLLGNLLCALVGLLDRFPLTTTLGQILDIIDRINRLLA